MLQLLYKGSLSGILPGIDQLQKALTAFADPLIPDLEYQIGNLDQTLLTLPKVQLSSYYLSLAIGQLQLGPPSIDVSAPQLQLNTKLLALKLQLEEIQALLRLTFDLSPSASLLLYTGPLSGMNVADYVGVLDGTVPRTSVVAAPILVLDGPQAFASVGNFMTLGASPFA